MAFLGGTSTAVLDTFYAFFTPGPRPRKVVAGIPDDVVAGLVAEDACFERPNTYGAGTGITYDPEVLKRVWETLVLEAGADVLLHSFLHGVELDAERRLVAVRVWTKGGEIVVRAGCVVDASGDADVVHLAGAPCELASATGTVQSLSTVFRLANVDVGRASSVPKEELWHAMGEAAASGGYALPRLEGSWHRTPQEGVVMALMTRMRGVDATDPDALARGDRGTAPVRRVRALPAGACPRVRARGGRLDVAGDRDPRVPADRRRVVLTADDVLGGRSFPDQIARCGAPIEDHHAGSDTRWAYVADGGAYGIPWRSLLPREVEGLVVAGRCFSATHDAHASARSMGTCMAMGQAAGTAAALSVARGVVPRELDPTCSARASPRTAPTSGGRAQPRRVSVARNR